MQLGDLLDDCSLDVATSAIEIERVEIDSRRCGPGTLFFAMPGHETHGARFARDAASRGCAAIVAGDALEAPAPVVRVPSTQLQALLAHVSAAVVGHPEIGLELVGVTGTNGKTSVATLAGDLARALGWNGGTIGTLTSERTTPAAPDLYRALADLKAGFTGGRPRSLVALEVSSHALDQHRVDGLDFAVVGFTNLGHDHLDYHGTLEQYFLAKAQLFSPERARRAVVWVDDPYGLRLAAMTLLPVTPVRRSDALDVASSLSGTSFSWRGLPVTTRLVGDYNVDNALMAMTMLSTLGVHDAHVVAAMGAVDPVPGRFEVVSQGEVVVVVDYAHTPEGLRRLLAAVRDLAPESRVLTVFGCGGDRDRAKRPEMGRAASEGSDVTIVTSDNPRSEPPETIIDAVMAGVATGATVERLADRREAIGEALRLAAPGDVVVIAGKGHEVTQTIGDDVIAFDDRAVARELMARSQC
jgi:UDP-N-acetylmuramoyl-L-alanyl-D-glutamate--2,6-diaminopimelate ligase